MTIGVVSNCQMTPVWKVHTGRNWSALGRCDLRERTVVLSAVFAVDRQPPGRIRDSGQQILLGDLLRCDSRASAAVSASPTNSRRRMFGRTDISPE